MMNWKCCGKHMAWYDVLLCCLYEKMEKQQKNLGIVVLVEVVIGFQ
jgi:hypothetical protein